MSIGAIVKSIFPSIHKRIVELLDEHRYKIQKERINNGEIEQIIEDIFYKHFGKHPDLSNPKTFNEKLQWLKLYWYDPEVIRCCNKHLVREFVKEKGLSEILIKQYNVFENVEDITFDRLPEKFVMKPSHDSGHVIICLDKKRFDLTKAKKNLKKWINIDYEYMSGEWPYHSKKYIVCEEYLENKQIGELLDYKFFCFSGEPYLCFFCSDRKNHVKSDFYDMNWKKQDFRWYYEPSGKTFPEPECFENMKMYAKVLSEGFPFVRVDFYEVNGKVYFGELTFFHGGGLGWFKPEKIDFELGNKIILPEKSDVSPWEMIINHQI